ncbi:hypothetical protein [Microbacterium excoecariae]|uniref:hypothetical protein n=1 Tax=Microbacterium excoecariae TaxID=2715210 RepID=UPI0014086348|nr:hypothetical protein [Microbacterium excoecariae]NHI17912.1 hypothetical protein [Microbacterium excoecariae]
MSLVANRLARTARIRRASPLTGAAALARHIVRADRRRMLVWAASIAAFTAYFSVALRTVFDDAALAARAEIMRTPTGIVMGGPGYGLNDYSPDVALANEGTLWIAAALAVLASSHVVRHTRAAEDDGRAELVRAQPVGRLAPAAAALGTLAALLAAIAGVGAGVFLATGATDAASAIAMMLACSASAFVFGAIALVCAQVASSARGALGLSLAALAAAVVVRAAGDLQAEGGSALSWLSPIAWAQQIRAFVDLRWWPIALAPLAAAGLVALAAALAGRRDLGAGLLPERPGRARAGWGLRGTAALALRQHRGAIAGTVIGSALVLYASGTMMGSLEEMVADLVATNAVLGRLFGTDPNAFRDGFLGILALYAAGASAALGIAVALRARREEESGRLELLLSHPVGRARWFAGEMLVAGAGALAVLAASLAALWAGALQAGVVDPPLAAYARVALSYGSAALVFPALAAALVGVWPRGAGLAWAGLAAAFVLEFFGPVFDVPEAVAALSPFHGVPEPFANAYDAAGPATLLGVAAALAAAGIVGLRARDLRSG